MTEKGMENNKVTVIGRSFQEFTFSHAVFGDGILFLRIFS